MNFDVLLFDDFETLDAMGPVEVIGCLKKFSEKFYNINFYSQNGGLITSSQQTRIETRPLSEIEDVHTILIPGGMGIRKEVGNTKLIQQIKDLSAKAKYVLTVCTGSALLAETGLLDGLKATSNKMSFDWVVEQRREVEWQRKARWVTDGKFYTSSGVSAGTDMTLGFVRDIMGEKTAAITAKIMEYVWNTDKDNDPFC